MIRHASTSGMDGSRPRSARRSASKLTGDTVGYAVVSASSVLPTAINVGGNDYNYYVLDNGATITLSTDGLVDILVVGSGGGGQYSTLAGGACGGSVVKGTTNVPAGLYTATIGIYGAANGGNGSACSINMLTGISAGGGLAGTLYAGTTAVAVGNNPGGLLLLPGGDGGAPAGHYGTSGTGGTGPVSDITGTALAYGSGGTAGEWDGAVGPTAPGGGAGNGGAGVDGRGGGGGGGRHSGGNGGRGGYGTVIIRVKV